MASLNELVDLSLFSISPTGDRPFPLSDTPESTSPQIRISSWEDIPPDYHPALLQDKPLPPLPTDWPSPPVSNEWPISPVPSEWPRPHGWIQSPEDRYHDLKPAKKRSGCFLSKIKRSKSDTSHGQNKKDKKSSAGTPKLTLAVPQQAARTVPSSPLLWVPDEQLWIVQEQPTFQQPTTRSNSDSALQRRLPSAPQRTMPQLIITDDEGDMSPPPSYSFHDHWESELRRSSAGGQWGAVATRMSRPASTGFL